MRLHNKTLYSNRKVRKLKGSTMSLKSRISDILSTKNKSQTKQQTTIPREKQILSQDTVGMIVGYEFLTSNQVKNHINSKNAKDNFDFTLKLGLLNFKVLENVIKLMRVKGHNLELRSGPGLIEKEFLIRGKVSEVHKAVVIFCEQMCIVGFLNTIESLKNFGIKESSINEFVPEIDADLTDENLQEETQSLKM